jgi:hypothetical protein
VSLHLDSTLARENPRIASVPERGDKSHTMNLCKIAAALFLLILSVTNVLAQAPRSNPGMNMKLSNQLIQPHSGFEMNGVDLYDAIGRKCGGNRS